MYVYTFASSSSLRIRLQIVYEDKLIIRIS